MNPIDLLAQTPMTVSFSAYVGFDLSRRYGWQALDRASRAGLYHTSSTAPDGGSRVVCPACGGQLPPYDPKRYLPFCQRPDHRSNPSGASPPSDPNPSEAEARAAWKRGRGA